MKTRIPFTILVISALLVSAASFNFELNAYAQSDEKPKDDKKEQRDQKIEEKKEQRDQKVEEKKEQRDQKVEEYKAERNQLKDDYRKLLEEKKNKLAEYKKDIKEKYQELKEEFQAKYKQLRISQISEIQASATESTSDEVDEDFEKEIKQKALLDLKQDFRQEIKNLKLEAKTYFDQLKDEFKIEKADRKKLLADRISELKEKYKDKIREQDDDSLEDDEDGDSDYQNKKVRVCHVPPGNPNNAHTLSISANAVSAHLGHGDYLGPCEVNDDTEKETDEEQNQEEETEEGKEITVKLEEELGLSQQ